MQHLIVAIIFTVCLYLIIRRIVRFISRTRKGNLRCSTCSETSCPLHQAYESTGDCGCGGTKKKDIISKNCKKTQP